MNMKDTKINDVLIIGLGPAGLTSSLYASRYSLTNLVVGEMLGGTAFEAHKVCNFPTEEEITGAKLTDKILKNAKKSGGEVLMGRVKNISGEVGNFDVELQNGDLIKARTLIFALGTRRKKLNVKGEDSFLGKGVSYCATCDGAFYKNKDVIVVGGANAAHTASVYLSEIASSVVQIYRGDKFKGESAWINEVLRNKNIEVIFENEVESVEGEEKLEKVILKDKYKGKNELKADGLFIEIGSDPKKELAVNTGVKVDEGGYIIVDEGQETNIEGIFAAGDITTNSNKFKQIITATSEGAIAANSAFKELKS